ncbi:MAG: TPM domain-containing protein [Rhodothermia bacterium]|nr:TPM domain-containing protein [Rhodothermia bacterium]
MSSARTVAKHSDSCLLKATRDALRTVVPLGILLIGLSDLAMAQPSVPVLTGRVVDEAGVLSDSAEREIAAILKAHEDSTSNQIAVLTIKSLGGYSVEEYALAVAREWTLGTAQNDNGVLFLLAIDDREMRIEVGYGLEGSLTDATAGRILRNEVRPYLRNGDFDGGVRNGVMAIVGAITGTYVVSEASGGEDPPFWFGLVFMIIPSFFVFMGVLSPGCARWFLFVFLMPFFWVSGLAITGSPYGAFIFVLIYAAVYIFLQSHPRVRVLRKTMKDKGSVKWGPFTISGSSGGFGGGGSFGGGGGFSGGGGSFGGGGASSSW